MAFPFQQVAVRMWLVAVPAGVWMLVAGSGMSQPGHTPGSLRPVSRRPSPLNTQTI